MCHLAHQNNRKNENILAVKVQHHRNNININVIFSIRNMFITITKNQFHISIGSIKKKIVLIIFFYEIDTLEIKTHISN